MNINLANADLDNSNKVTIDLASIKGQIKKATILTSKDMKDHNTFEKPNVVAPTNFKGATIKDGKLIVDMPKMSIVTIQIK